MGKNSNTKRSKTVLYKCKKMIRDGRREEGKTLEDISQVYSKDYLSCMLVSIFLQKNNSY